MSLNEKRRRVVVVVGGGPVGCLAALAFGRRGWDVTILEGRPDPRLPSLKATAQQRSINLAISSRGLTALKAIDPSVATRFLETVIPMRARMIHGVDGRLNSQPYDINGQCINSIDRALLNEELIKEASQAENVHILFQTKVQSVDFDRKYLSALSSSKEELSMNFDLCIGADGSYSVIRRQMMRVTRMDYHQEYIPHDYIELRIPAGIDASGNNPQFLLDPNHLHIWPRHSFMLIALPNKDFSFTCTLFAPTEEFDRLSTPESILAWFKSNFPDAVSVIGEEALLRDFEKNPRSALITTKSNPYHYKDCAILLGDAAHSMVPFFGQGLNCGLEDVRVLDTLIEQANIPSSTRSQGRGSTLDKSLADILRRYSETRHDDLVAICDLAMDNYVTMRHSVTTPAYIFRKALDNILCRLSSGLASLPSEVQASEPLLSKNPKAFASGEPKGWLPLYTMVTFRPDITYAAAKRKSEKQSRILSATGWVGAAVGVGVISVGWLSVMQRMRR